MNVDTWPDIIAGLELHFHPPVDRPQPEAFLVLAGNIPLPLQRLFQTERARLLLKTQNITERFLPAQNAKADTTQFLWLIIRLQGYAVFYGTVTFHVPVHNPFDALSPKPGSPFHDPGILHRKA